MNTIIFKRKLCAFYEIIREQKQQTHLNPQFVWLMYTTTRFSLILRQDQFNDKQYQDKELILVKDFINWFSFLTPISQIQVQTFQTIFLVVIAAFHLLPIFIIGFEIKQFNCFQQFQNLYFTYYQILILYPSFIHIHYLQYINTNTILIWCCKIPILINYVIFSYFQRNYLLPILNPFTKRYRIKNYLLNLIEILVLINLPYFEEIIQSMIVMIFFLIQLIDSIFNQPYSIDININYCFCSSILLYGSGIKCLSIYLNQKEYLFYSFMLIPLLSLFMKRILILTYNMSLEQVKLNKSLLFQIIDEFYSKNPIMQSKILYILKIKYKILIDKQLTQSQKNHYIMMLILRLQDQYQQQKRLIDEDLQLYKIFFLYNTQEKLNLAYIQIKKYQIQASNQSLYFQILEMYCSKLIMKKLNKNVKLLQGKLEIQQIKQSQQLIEKCIPLILEILELKNKLWESLLIGYERIEQLGQQCIKLSDKVLNLKLHVFSDLDINILLISKQLMKLNILDLRLLSLIFGSVLNDYHITFDIEQRIDDMLNQERNILSRNIQNVSLLNDDVIIISISMMKNQGQILNKDKSKILKYFKFPNDESFQQQISQLNQIIPEYLVVKHDQFLNNFLSTGESGLFNISHDVFPSYYSGYSFLVTLQLIPSYDEMNDYTLSAILKKSYEHSDFIIFDESGRILGISEYMLQVLIVNVSQEFNKDILNSYIYFWFKDLLVIINQKIESMTNYTEQCTLFSQTTQIQPIKNLEELIKLHETYYKKHILLQYNSTKTEQDQLLEKQQYINPSCYEINYVIQMYDFINQNIQHFIQNQVGVQVVFDLQIQKLQGYHSLFILQINEYNQKELKLINSKSVGTISAYSPASKIKSQTEQRDENSLSNDDMDESHQEFIINQTIINKLVLRQGQFEVKNVIQNMQRANNFEIIVDKDNKESNLISPRSNREIFMQKGLIEDDSEELQGNESNVIKSSSQRENIILDDGDNQQIDFQQEKQSRSSATSNKTQNSVYHLIRKLQYKVQYQRGIVKAIINTLFLSIFLIILISIELSIERKNVDQLKFSIPLVRLPQRFNRLYCTFLAVGQLQLQSKLLNLSYGEYYEYRIKNESAQKRKEIQNLMLDLENQFSSMQQNEQLPLLQMRIINEYIFQLENTTMLQFDIIVNEHTSLINEYIQIQNQTYQDISKIVTLLEFFKANLIAQLNITIKIVDQIEQDFFELIDYCQIEWLVFLTIMLWLIIFFLILQINHWQEPYKYMQVILLLISKISEKDIELTISKTLYLIDRITNNPHQIKNINYFRGCFLNQKQSMTFQSVKISEISKSNQNVKTSQQKPKKSSRIQDTSFSILNIRIILLILWLILSGLVLSAFIILVKNMQDSQPELRLTMQFVKFKENLDGIMILCYLLKNQQSLIQQTIQTFTLNSELKNEDGYFQIQYQELLKQFNPMFLEMDEIYSNIYQDVIASYKINSVNKNHLINLYEQDLCQIIPNILPFCAYENGSFLYFPNYPSATSLSNNQQIYKYGINGIYQQIISIFNTHYTLEKIGIEDQNMTNNILFLGNPEFIQTILPYFFDISYAILEFYYTIINSTLDILESDYEMVLQFYISAGIACLLILCTVILIRAITLQRKVRLILQSIILLPYESLQDQSILISIRKIDRNL